MAGVNNSGLYITADQVTVQGLEFIHSPGGANPGNMDSVLNLFTVDQVGLLAEDVNHLTLMDNRFYDNSYGIMSLTDGANDYTVNIQENDASRNTETGILLVSGNLSGPTHIRINNNITEDNGLGVLSGASGIFGSLFNVGDNLTLEINGNRANRNTDNGILFSSGFVDGNIDAQFNYNRADDNWVGLFSGSRGLRLILTRANDVTLEMNNNQAHRNTSIGIVLNSEIIFGNLNAKMNKNVAEDNGLGIFGGIPGVSFFPDEIQGKLVVEMNNNSAHRNAGIGILHSPGFTGGNSDIQLNHNVANNNGSHGILSFPDAVGNQTAQIIGNSANENTRTGINFVSEVFGAGDLQVSDNIANDNGEDGLVAVMATVFDVSLFGRGNVAVNNGGNDFNVFVQSSMGTETVDFE